MLALGIFAFLIAVIIFSEYKIKNYNDKLKSKLVLVKKIKQEYKANILDNKSKSERILANLKELNSHLLCEAEGRE